MIPLTDIEDNIVSRIAAIMPNSFGIVAAVGDEKAMKAAKSKFPAAFVILEEESMPEEPLTWADVMGVGFMRWQVFIIARSMRGPGAGRKGPGGTYDLSDDVRDVLRRFDPIENVMNGSHPMKMIGRRHIEDPENSEYSMQMRFAHESDDE